MKRIAFTLAGAAAALALAAGADTTETYDFTGFTAVETAAGIDVEVQQADTYSVVADFERGGPEDIKIEQKGDTLHLSRKSSGMWNRGNKARVTVRVTAPNVSRLAASSGSNLRATGLSAGEVSVSASSGASVDVNGSCETLAARASSGANASLKDLLCASVTTSASSGASLSAYASASATSKTSSGASVSIYGDPEERSANTSRSGGSTSFR